MEISTGKNLKSRREKWLCPPEKFSCYATGLSLDFDSESDAGDLILVLDSVSQDLNLVVDSTPTLPVPVQMSKSISNLWQYFFKIFLF